MDTLQIYLTPYLIIRYFIQIVVKASQCSAVTCLFGGERYSPSINCRFAVAIRLETVSCIYFHLSFSAVSFNRPRSRLSCSTERKRRKRKRKDFTLQLHQSDQNYQFVITRNLLDSRRCVFKIAYHCYCIICKFQILR